MEVGMNLGGQAVTLKDKAAALQVAEGALGEIVSLIMRSKRHAQIMVGDLEALIMPALLERQFLIVQMPMAPGDIPLPGAVLFWAEVSPEIDKRLETAQFGPIALSREDRSSGSIVWITDVAGDPRMINTGLDNLMQTRFAGRSVKLHTQDADGVAMMIEHRR